MNHNMTNKEIVQQQYQSSDNLNIRQSIHTKYSTNLLGFGNWIMQQYQIQPGYHLLELGCGTGSMWKDNLDILCENTSLVLSDSSLGMIEEAKRKLPKCPRLSFDQIDITNIRFPDHTFDVVIANMMLYHIQDIDAAIKEVRRVLKPTGKFYCAWREWNERLSNKRTKKLWRVF